jgi:hypothetical protein
MHAARPRAVRISTVARHAAASAALLRTTRAARICPLLATECPAALAFAGSAPPSARRAHTRFNAAARDARRRLCQALVELGGHMNRWSPRLNPICANQLVLLAVCSALIGCGGTAASASGSGGTHSGAGASSGGASNGGASSGGASSGGASSGGASSGGASSGGSGGVAPSPCFGGNGALVPAAKACETDADCEALPTANCCGPGVIVGIAISARAYEACYPYPTGCPAGLGCASFASTEDGMQPGYPPNSFKLSCAAVDGGPKSCRTVSKDSSEGTPWSCHCSTGSACCQAAAAP